MEKPKLLNHRVLKVLLVFIISLTSAFADKQDEVNTPAWEAVTNVKSVSPNAADKILKQHAKEKAFRFKERKQRMRQEHQNKILKSELPQSSRIDSVLEYIFPSAHAIETLLGGSTASEEAEITELARALRYDPDLIYEYVYNDIAYEPTFGDKKGAVGTLLDKSGNSFDQASLMIMLLKASNYQASYVYGKILLGQQKLNSWLGYDNIFLAKSHLSKGGIPVDRIGDNLEITHVWVKVIIDSKAYYFDPSLKSHTFVPGLDLSGITGFNENGFIGNALSGTIPSSDSIQYLNRANIESDLTVYANNLISYIKQNKPDASLKDIIGGKRINPTQLGIRQTALPYELSVTDEWVDDIPVVYQTTLEIGMSGILQSFRSSEIYGKRLTITFDSSNRPVLKLEGITKATGSTVSNSVKITLDIDHPYADQNGKFADQKGDQFITLGGTYAVVNGWGAHGPRHYRKTPQMVRPISTTRKIR